MRQSASLTRIFPTLDLSIEAKSGSGTGYWGLFAQAELLKLQKSGQFPDEPVTTHGRRGPQDFYHNCTNSILQQMKRKFWKIGDALFRIS
jgi:hypothetical protein